VRVGRGFMQENLLQVGPARDSNSRVPVRGADRSRRSGVGEQRGGGRVAAAAAAAAAARPPRAAVEPHPAVGSRHGRPGIACAGGGREIRRRKPRLHLRRGTGEGRRAERSSVALPGPGAWPGLGRTRI